jgi:hypothetical protein
VSPSPASFAEVVRHGGGARLEAGSSSVHARPPPSAPKVARHEGKAPVEDVAASGSRREGKAPAGPSSKDWSTAEPRGFMVDAWHVRPAHTPPATDGGWQVVNRRK